MIDFLMILAIVIVCHLNGYKMGYSDGIKEAR